MGFSEVSPCRQTDDRTYRPQPDPEVHKEMGIAERDDSSPLDLLSHHHGKLIPWNTYQTLDL